jgi:hypothetical protein
MDQHPLGIDIVVGRDDAVVLMPMGYVTMGSAVDKEITPGEGKRCNNGVQGALRMAIEEDFVCSGRNTETWGMVLMGRAAGLPLVPVLPSMLTAVRDGSSQGSGIGAGRERGLH